MNRVNKIKKVTKVTKVTKMVRGGDMTPEEQDEFNEMSQAVQQAQTEANEMAVNTQAAAAREASLREQNRRLANVAAQTQIRNDELVSRQYEQASYDRINSYILGMVPLDQRLRFASTIADLTRTKLTNGASEQFVITELMDLVHALSKKVAPPKKRSAKKRSSKKKNGKSGKKK